MSFLLNTMVKRELTNGGKSPKFSEKIGGKSFLEKLGLFRADWGLSRAYRRPIRTDSSAPHSHKERAEIAPKALFLAPLAPFGPSPRLQSPRLDFPLRLDVQKRRWQETLVAPFSGLNWILWSGWGASGPQSRVLLRNPEKGRSQRRALREFVANCAPNLRKIAGISFCASEEGCAKLSRI